MNSRSFIFMGLISLLLFPLHSDLFAQGEVADYQRAWSLSHRFTNQKVTELPESVRWRNSSCFTFEKRDAKGISYFIGEITNFTTAAHILQKVNVPKIEKLLKEKGSQNFTPGTLRLGYFHLPKPPFSALTFAFNGQNWMIQNPCTTNPTLEKVEKLAPPPSRQMGNPAPVVTYPMKPYHWATIPTEQNGAPAISPNHAWRAYIKDSNLYLSKPDGSNERQMTHDGCIANYYSSNIYWSPDSRTIALFKLRPPSQKRNIYFVQSSPHVQLQPIPYQIEYPKPGDELMYKEPRIIHADTGKVIIPDNKLFQSQYALEEIHWGKDSKRFYFGYNERGHKCFRLLEIERDTGLVHTVVEERSKTFIKYYDLFRKFLANDRELIWVSERDQWNHIYLFDLVNRKMIRQITKGSWVVRKILHIDEASRQIYFSACGMNPKEDPYQLHFYRIDFEGKNLVSLTPEDGEHSVLFNADHTALIDTYSKVSQPPITLLRSVENPQKPYLLGKANITALCKEGWRAPEIFAAPGRDGKTMMWGVITRPTNFDPKKKYPVIEYIYAGPGSAYTPKSFAPYHYVLQQIAELGFIVVQLDAMGTSYRGKKFEDVCYKNLKDSGFPDRICWIRAAAKHEPAMDVTRVGIYGSSAGGQSALAAVLHHPEFYKAAYSACGCHDNRMDKIWWNELWMGYPVDKSYEENSNVVNAHKLSRPLMLVVGEMDDNVDPSSSFQVANALINANKPFEFVVLPNAGHTMGNAYGEHKRFDFFVKTLIGKDPPAWSSLIEK